MADMKQASRGPRDGLSPASIALVRLTWAALMSTASLTHTDVLIPPQSAADDHSDWLRSATAFGRRDDPSSLSYRMWGAGDTNVLPLLEADNEPLSPKLHPRSTSRFLSHSAIVRQLHYRDWRLTRGWANVSYLHGNGDAGQLWLDLASDTQRPGVRSTPYLEGRETKLAWWGLSRRFSVSSPKLGDVALHGRVGLRLLEAFRHRKPPSPVGTKTTSSRASSACCPPGARASGRRGMATRSTWTCAPSPLPGAPWVSGPRAFSDASSGARCGYWKPTSTAPTCSRIRRDSSTTCRSPRARNSGSCTPIH